MLYGSSCRILESVHLQSAATRALSHWPVAESTAELLGAAFPMTRFRV